MAKRQPKSKAKKKRTKKYRTAEQSRLASGSRDYTGSGGGVMRRMVGGFRRAVGAEAEKKKGAGDAIWTILLILIVAAIVFWQFRPS